MENQEVCYDKETSTREETREQQLQITINEEEKVRTPQVGMVFDSIDEVRDFYKKYAYNHGFGIITRSTKTDDDGNIKYYTISCARAGQTKLTRKNPLLPLPSTKINCKARINVRTFEDGRLCLSGVFLEHNHELSPGKSRHFLCNKQLDSWAKRRLDLNDQAGIPLSKNFHSLVVEARGYENLTFGEKECRNYIDKARRLRLGVGDAESLYNYFVRMQNQNSKFFYVLDVNEESHVRNIFWADARSQSTYESFGDVITFDTTYLTNKYDMPFALFVGVNHHGQSTLLGCGLLSNEDTETYIWLFKSWLACMSGHSPKAIVTDQCKAIQAAVAEVFPEAKHRLCLWHILKKLPMKLGGLAEYRAIKKTLKNIVYESLTPSDFEEGWTKLIAEFKLEGNEWLRYLYLDRKRWVPIFVKKTFWAGMSTTQRSESMNAFFDGYVHSKTTLKQFVEQYDNALGSKVEKEKKADFASFNSIIPMITDFRFEKQFQEAYTNELFKEFQDELRGLIYCNICFVKIEGSISTFQVKDYAKKKDGSRRKVVYDVLYNEAECDVRCLCHLFEFRGILCRHTIAVLVDQDVKGVPLRYILTRWRKDIKRKHTYVKSSYDNSSDSKHMKLYNMLCNRFHNIAEIGAETDDNSDILMKILDDAEEIMLKRKSFCGSSQLNKESSAKDSDELNHLSKKLHSPLQVRSKGRPPSKRKESKVEQILRSKKKVSQTNTSKVNESDATPSHLSPVHQIPYIVVDNHFEQPVSFLQHLQAYNGFGTNTSIYGGLFNDYIDLDPKP
ncbi:protein FAR1-RELATED SEQUENCE 6-like [Actinidia eriantha]|uniref:protein FAR1-RELATED SEQUENCE 6-like n=1 Tax=Actinidia eriantha TaxID=165200 RepID=UPI0025890464|nr:protein FAR1-RELATED SEQUENCE 6-like [Actinidia eriantha]